MMMLKKFLSEFKQFAMRGNVLDMAVGVIIGGAFGKIVSSLVTDVITPVIGKLTGGVDFTNLFLVLSRHPFAHDYKTLAAAKAAGMVTVNYGVFLNNTIDFIITAFAIFLLVKAVNAVRKLEAAKPPPPPPPSDEVKLLTEIRDLLRTR